MEKFYPGEVGEALSQNSFHSGSWDSAAPKAASTVAAPEWFAIYTMARHEKRVAQYLGLKEIEHYLPLYRVQRRWNDGSKVALDLPLLPGYVFVRIGGRERVRVLEVPGVVKFVTGTGTVPVALSDGEINAVRSGVEQGRAEPFLTLPVGRRARISSGPLRGMEGVVVRWKSAFRVVVTLELLMRRISVEVDRGDLEPLREVQRKRASSTRPRRNCWAGSQHARAADSAGYEHAGAEASL